MRDARVLLFAALAMAGCNGGLAPEARPRAPDGAEATVRRPESQAAPRTPAAGPPVVARFTKVEEKASQNQAHPDNLARHCADAIAGARRSLDLAGFEIDNARIVEAVVAAKLRGVAVRAITESEYEQELGPQTFRRVGIPVVADGRSGLMHQKFLVIDGQAVWTGSFNFTENCAYRNNNNAVLVRDERVAANYANWFEWFWTAGKDNRRKPDRRTPHPDVRLADGTRVESRFTTLDRPEALALAAIRDARKSLRVMMFAFTSKPLADALVERANAGVAVTVVLESRETSHPSSAYEKLRGAGNVRVLLDGNPFNMHHKVTIVDDATVLLGSYNYTRGAETDNDENLLAISGNREVIAAYAEEFERVRQRALAKAEAAARAPERR